MNAKKISTGLVAGLLTASLAVAPHASAQDTAPAPEKQSSIELSSGDGQGKGSSDQEGSSDQGKDSGKGSSNLGDKQKKIIGGVVGGLAGIALLAGIYNFLKTQGGNLPFKLPF